MPSSPPPASPFASHFYSAKAAGRRLSMLTCYDYTAARLLAQSPVDGILVGDSLAMAVHGHSSTLHATVDLMRLHTAAVARGAPDKFIVADMPFLSFRMGIPAALEAARELLTAGAHAVKLEGVDGHQDVIERLIESGIPVMGHLGMQPQSVNAYGGFKVQGRTEAAQHQICRQAAQLESLGVFSIVLECIPATLAARITASAQVPTIGIGAGPDCDGQILVLPDLLGLNTDFKPKFVRTFTAGSNSFLEAVRAYHDAVLEGSFPSAAESYK